MQVIRLARYAMLRKLWALAVILVFLCALPFVVWGAPQTPPQALLDRANAHPIVYDKKCNFQSMTAVECLIFYEKATDTAWLILFDMKKGEPFITHVIEANEDGETIHWCRPDVCI